MRITKERFVETFNTAMNVYDQQDYMNQLLQDSGVLGYIYPPEGATDSIGLITDLYKDIDHDNWIQAFVYDYNFGRTYKPKCVIDYNGNNVDLSSAESLYDALLRKEQSLNE